MPSVPERAGSMLTSGPTDVPDVLGLGATLAREWAGGRALAVLAGGSHAAGEGVWFTHGGRRVALSDVDLWTVVPDEATKRAARARARAALPGLGARLLEHGLAAPLDAGFYTPRDLETLPARPSTLELARRGRAIWGDTAWLRRVPAYQAVDVSREESALLLENRGFELLLAWFGLGGVPLLERLKARHGTLKATLDLATVMALEAGVYQDSAAARTQWAEAWLRGQDMAGAETVPPPRAPRPDETALAPRLAALWEAALAWKRSAVHVLAREAAMAEWARATKAWATVWLGFIDGADQDPYLRAVSWAGRARWRRRMRQALWFESPTGAGPGLAARLGRWNAGTPQHRLNAAAAVVLISALQGNPAAPVLTPEARRALGRLGVIDPRATSGAASAAEPWARTARALVRAWDTWLLDGQRTADWT